MLNRLSQTGTYTVNGVSFPVQESLPASVAEALDNSDAPLPNYETERPSNRRSLRRGRRAQKSYRVSIQGHFSPSMSARADGNN